MTREERVKHEDNRWRDGRGYDQGQPEDDDRSPDTLSPDVTPATRGSSQAAGPRAGAIRGGLAADVRQRSSWASSRPRTLARTFVGEVTEPRLRVSHSDRVTRRNQSIRS